MEITVVEQEENPMLHRTDVTFRVSHVEATPDRLAVRDSLAARLNKDADEVVIRKLDTKFGMRTTYGEAKVYQSPAVAKDVEQDYVLRRNKIAGAEGEVEPDAAEPPEEAGEPEVEEAPDEPEAEEDADEVEEAEEADETEEAAEDDDAEEATEDTEAAAEEVEDAAAAAGEAEATEEAADDEAGADDDADDEDEA